jgi:exodeoxyribonuclease VII large subunit
VLGVVTSPSGAVFHDIQNVVRRRYPLVELLLSPTQVQGDRAAPQIVAAIEALNRDGRADVIIVARGGGSLEELWPFNEESVARAIYASRIPVVSAVGHETDVCIADLVADVRAPTPSAAAELVVPDGNVLRQDLSEIMIRWQRAVAFQLQHRSGEVRTVTGRLDQALPHWETWRRRVDDLGRGAHHSLTNRLALARVEMVGLGQRLDALDPAAILRRGFSVVQRTDDDTVVTAAAQVSRGDALSITLSDGLIPATAGAMGRLATTASKKKLPEQLPDMERLL